MIELGKIPPQAVDVEGKVLASILSNPEIITDIFDIITSDAFYKDSNRIIFNECLNMFKDGLSIDMITIIDQLRRKNLIDNIDGDLVIINLFDSFVPEMAANIEKHCLILKQYQLQRFVIARAQEQINLAYENSDPSEIIKLFSNTQEEINNIIEYGSNVKSFNNNLDAVLDEISERVKTVRNGEIVGIPTGLVDLNKVLTFRGNDLIIIAARPGMGKTAMSLKHAKEAAQKGYHVRFYSLEMSDLSLTERILLSESDIKASKMRDGYLSDAELTSLEMSARKLQDLNIWIDDKPARTASSILANAKKYHKKGLCDIVIIDYLQLTESESDFGSTNDKVSKTTRKLKEGAKELDIPFLVLSQLSRAVEQRGGEKRPQLSDLRDSGAIEQDADKVLFIYRPEKYGILEDEAGNDLRGVGLYIVDKNREGSCTDIKFRYNESLTKIYDYDTIYEDPNEVFNPDNNIEPNKDFDVF